MMLNSVLFNHWINREAIFLKCGVLGNSCVKGCATRAMKVEFVPRDSQFLLDVPAVWQRKSNSFVSVVAVDFSYKVTFAMLIGALQLESTFSSEQRKEFCKIRSVVHAVFRYFAVLLYLKRWNQEGRILERSKNERTNDAKRKWHWGLGLIQMYSRLMADFISRSHCYAMSVLLQQNEYCILRVSACVCVLWW